MKTVFLIFSALVSISALADQTPNPADPNACPVIRTATAHIKVGKTSWTQQGGNWMPHDEIVCEKTISINVNSSTVDHPCITYLSQDFECPMTINDQLTTADVNASIMYDYTLAKPTKTFMTYMMEIPSNPSSNTSTRSRGNSFSTHTLNLKDAQINLSYDMPMAPFDPSAAPPEDYFATVSFEDQNAK